MTTKTVNSNNSGTRGVLRNLWSKSNNSRKKQYVFLLLLLLFTSFIEAFSIAAVVPFLAVLTSPSGGQSLPYVGWFLGQIGVTTDRDIVRAVAIGFIFITISAAGLRLLLLWSTIKITNSIGAELSEDIYRRTLYQPYSVHIARNSSQIIDGITRKVSSLMNGAISPFITMLTTGAILFSVLITLIAIGATMAILALIGFAAVYILVVLISKKQLNKNGEQISYQSTQVIKALQEGLGGIRDVLVDGTQEAYCKIYTQADGPYRRAAGKNAFINSSPRYLIEALGMTLIAGLSVYYSEYSPNFSYAIPVLGALALGAQKSLPLLQQFYSAWASIKGSQASVFDALQLLSQPMPKYCGDPSKTNKLSFNSELELRGVSFAYPGSPKLILDDINLIIPRGAKVGIMGLTGAGKSTLTDIMMALLHPTSGTMMIDGVWIDQQNYRDLQKQIAHVPQSIFLADTTVAENIAFGVSKEKINYDRVRFAAKAAQIDGVIEEFPKQYETRIGERGVRISGGQRQRIGIARALYKEGVSILFFDEATSALDSKTEESVIDSINLHNNDLTLIIVAHRLSTLKYCHFIVNLTKGKVASIETYDKVIKNNAQN